MRQSRIRDREYSLQLLGAILQAKREEQRKLVVAATAKLTGVVEHPLDSIWELCDYPECESEPLSNGFCKQHQYYAGYAGRESAKE